MGGGLAGKALEFKQSLQDRSRMNIEQYNLKFGLPGQLQFHGGGGGLPMIDISNDQARARISVYGAQVLSFCPAQQSEDLLFLSQQALYQPGKAIRGGIPICWPWFGPDPEGLGRASHGFARDRIWQVLNTAAPSRAETVVTLGLTDSPETRAIWPHPFELTLEVTVGETLTLALVTRNRGQAALTLSQALHTYFRVGDLEGARLWGLEKETYLDKLDGGACKQQVGVVAIREECDRIYTHTAPTLDPD
ncbi:MAG: D-hexose-6-phosphate mutarotase [Acaryochloridaceae cyanobacterium CSU_5_19]|nr:D-hexose-6-phosphate mutarotase [Acaryochloridaceae cyanobacterium CSU_5_19]